MKLTLITAALYADIARAGHNHGFYEALSTLSHPPTSVGGYHIYDDFNSLFVRAPMSPHAGGDPDHYAAAAYYQDVFVFEEEDDTPRGPVAPLHDNIPPEEMAYAPVHEYHLEAPDTHFEEAVEAFDVWQPIFRQADYEERLEEEAKIMTSLEAIFDIIGWLETEIEIVEDGVKQNADTVEQLEAVVNNMHRASQIIDLSYDH